MGVATPSVPPPLFIKTLVFIYRMVYKILPYSFKKAKEEGVVIKASSNPLKKIDVFDKDGVKLASVGGVRKNGIPYNDYPTYIKKSGVVEADKKRKAYLKRHAKNAKLKDGKRTPSYFADVLLW